MLMETADFPIKCSPNFKRRESLIPRREHLQGQRAEEMGCRLEVRRSGASEVDLDCVRSRMSFTQLGPRKAAGCGGKGSRKGLILP